MATQAHPALAKVAKRHPLAFILHSLIGVQLSLFLAFVCLTGTIATVSHEIEWLLLPKVRASASVAAKDLGAMWDAAQAAHPEGWIRSLGTYDRADSRIFAWRADVALPDGREIAVLVDPATAQVTGEMEGISFHSFMRGLHYYLFTPGDWGFYLVTSLGFVLLTSLVSGLMLYKRFWRGFLRWPRFGRGLRTWMGDLHRLAALWSLWFVAIMAVTTLWYLVERAGIGWEPSPPSAPPGSERMRPVGAMVASWAARAQAEMPGIAITGILLPYGAGDPVTVQGQWQAWLVRERSNAVFIDPGSGKMLGRRIAHELPATVRWVHSADPLHFGNFAGMAGKLVWVVFGLLLTCLSLSGVVINAKRLAHAASRTPG
jgi:uncharacterized iron-regulated membrane protein